MISKKEIEALFAQQLTKIKSPELREKVVEAWFLGCERGNWQEVTELKDMPFTLLTETRGVNFIEHTIAVTEGALALAEAQINTYNQLPYNINIDRLVAGGLLHDVGKLMEIEKDGSGGYRKSHSGKCARHPISGAILAAEWILGKTGIFTLRICSGDGVKGGQTRHWP